MTVQTPDPAEPMAVHHVVDDAVPSRGYQLTPTVGLGGSAGAIPALQAFFRSVPPKPGLAFVVVMHLAAEHESTLPELLQRCTSLPVLQARDGQQVEADTVYVIPPGKSIAAIDSRLSLTPRVPLSRGRHVEVDLFFRTLADTYGPHAAAVVLSGADGDGAIGIKRIKERGGLTVAQDPDECAHPSMPRTAIETGMIDWVLPAREIATRLLAYFNVGKQLQLPSEDEVQAGQQQPGEQEAQLTEVLAFLRNRTGHDFTVYKRATVVRRIGRRMQVNGVTDLPGYLTCLRTQQGEAGALLQDLLISVTNFFRDADCFAALEAHLAGLFRGKGPGDVIRAWVPACATGEEAYSLGMLLSEQARALDAPPAIQIFATDLDDEAIRTAREGLYRHTIEADVSQERLRRFFVKETRGYQVRRELREMVLFAQHDVLKDSPFSRLDLVSCRNLLIYLKRATQQRVFDTFHFSLLPTGLLFLGSSENVEETGSLFTVLDKKSRIFAPRPAVRSPLTVPVGPGGVLDAAAAPDQLPRPLAAQPVVAQLERELERAKSNLRETVEQYEASTEELKAGNEELQAMNEELRSATEELETSREELQSINEELTTVNQELKCKVDELAHANSDIHNLIDATSIATIFLDRDLCITRYTPTAVSLFNLIATDVGRPLADLSTRLDYPGLDDDAKRVLARLVPVEREVGLPDGSWFLARLLPYRTIEDRIAGVVASFIDITERKQAEEVRLWLSAVVASSTDAIISFSPDQTILSWNAGAERMFGYGVAQAIGKPLAQLAGAGGVLGGLSAERPVSNFETVGRRQDGHEVHIALSVSPIKDARDKVIGGTAIARDITQQKAAAEALRSSEERLRLLIENASEFAIFSTDLQRRVTTWNSGAERLLGYAEKEVLGQPGDLIFTPEDRAAGAPEQEMRVAVAEDRAADERVHQRKDGSRFWASGAMMLMRDGAGRPVGFVKILRDQTAQRESQLALERSQADLLQALAQNEKARVELQAADATKDRFLAVLSHELRNPLASIDSAAALLLTPGLRQKDRDEAADVVKRQAGAMKSLLDELLDVSRLKLGRFKLHQEKTRLDTVIAAALEATRPLLDAAGHELVLDLPTEAIELDADPLRLVQVVSNLLTNAIKYTPARGTIGLAARLDGPHADIMVSDTGMGMEPGQIEHMFEMFAQADPLADRSHGLGIGLALVKSIVELHGGQVNAASPGPGKGSEFHVLLPARRGAALPPATPQPPAAATPAGEPPAESTRKPKKRGLIVIADDNADAGWGIARLLEIAGFATLRVQGGLEAVKETRRHKPDVGIIDIGMPDLSGHEVARQIRETEWGKHMVLIAATGWGQESDERAAMEAGFDTHMTKPVDLRKLSATVDELLARRRG